MAASLRARKEEKGGDWSDVNEGEDEEEEVNGSESDGGGGDDDDDKVEEEDDEEGASVAVRWARADFRAELWEFYEERFPAKLEAVDALVNKVWSAPNPSAAANDVLATLRLKYPASKAVDGSAPPAGGRSAKKASVATGKGRQKK